MWNEQPTLLLVDDDNRLTTAIARFLSRSGYEVEIAPDGPTGLERYHQRRPDLVVLDVMMPGMDGWEVCRRLRETSRVPIIMLTARSTETDRVMGLRLGADDYLSKPFSLKELEARIEAVMRRVHMQPPQEDEVLYDDGRLRLESSGMQVSLDGEAVNLTATERRLLFALAEQPGRVCSPEYILRQVWGPEYEGQADYVKLYIWRVRQKVEPNPARPVYVQTERGLGYRFVPQPARERQAPEPVPARNGHGHVADPA
jgi:DNA-binding response OmpR family regulator